MAWAIPLLAGVVIGVLLFQCGSTGETEPAVEEPARPEPEPAVFTPTG